MFSRYTCSSSIDDDALAVALQAVGDCTLSADCLTSYNQYYGGWATAVGNEIVVGDLTEETKAKFSKQYLLGSKVEYSPYASISWYSDFGLTISSDQPYIPWNIQTPPGTVQEQLALQSFAINEVAFAISVQVPGTYFITYSIRVKIFDPTDEEIYNFGVVISTPGLQDTIFAESYLPGTNTAVTLSGSCICDLKIAPSPSPPVANDQVFLKNLVVGASIRAYSMSFSIRFISPLSTD